MSKKAEQSAAQEDVHLNKIWTLLRLYLMWGLVKAYHAQTNIIAPESVCHDKKELYDKQRKILNTKRSFEHCMQAVKERSQPLELLHSAMSAVKNREFLSQICWNERSVSPWLWELFPAHLSFIFSHFMSSVWQNKAIGFEIAYCQVTNIDKEFHFIIKENNKNVVSVCLEEESSKQFISLHASDEADEFYIWLSKYYDCNKVPTEKEIKSFDENKLRSRGK